MNGIRFAARLIESNPFLTEIFRRSSFPGRGRIVAEINSETLPKQTIARVNGIVFDLSLTDWIQRHIYFGVYERRELRIALRRLKPGGIVFDVGANVGYYSLNLARRVAPSGAVHAFEPDLEIVQLLIRNCALNPFGEQVTINCSALSDASGQARFFQNDITDSSAWGSLESSRSLGTKNRIVSTESLDSYVDRKQIPRIDLLKIDVEGSELKVLSGASRTLQNQRVGTILIEYTGADMCRNGLDFEGFLKLMEGYGYCLASDCGCVFDMHQKHRLNENELYGNLLFCPLTRSF